MLFFFIDGGVWFKDFEIVDIVGFNVNYVVFSYIYIFIIEFNL